METINSNQQMRIYLPGVFDKNFVKSLYKITSVKEVRDGSALPLPSKNQVFSKVWHIEFENYPTPPKFYAWGKLPERHIDEIVQYRLYPPGLTEGNNIVTTSYLQSKVSEEDLSIFKECKHCVRIYDSEYPILNSYFNKCDGTVILADKNGINNLLKILEKEAPYGFINTKERRIFWGKLKWQEKKELRNLKKQ